MELRGGRRFIDDDGEVETYVYQYHRLVLKVFHDNCVEKYQREVGVYQQCSALQGTVIPTLYGCGRASSPPRRFIAVSYEGQALTRCDDSDRSVAFIKLVLEGRYSLPFREIIQQLVQALHDTGFHHHDLELCNIVKDEGGVIKLIDFALSGRCELSGCDSIEHL